MWLPLGYQQETDSTGLATAAVGLRTASGSISGATNATPIVVTSNSHGLTTPARLTGVYRYAVTNVDGSGETLPGPATRQILLDNEQGYLSGIPLGPSGTTSRKIYRTAADDPAGAYKLVGTLADNTTTTFLDAVADAALGVNAPSASTAGVAAPTDAPVARAAPVSLLSFPAVVIVEGVGGNAGANGQWVADVLSANTFSLRGSKGTGAYTSGGAWREIPAGTQWVLVRAEGDDVRWRDDGTDPTATVGNQLKAGDVMEYRYSGIKLTKLKFFGKSATSVLNVEFYKTA